MSQGHRYSDELEGDVASRHSAATLSGDIAGHGVEAAVASFEVNEFLAVVRGFEVLGPRLPALHRLDERTGPRSRTIPLRSTASAVAKSYALASSAAPSTNTDTQHDVLIGTPIL